MNDMAVMETMSGELLQQLNEMLAPWSAGENMPERVALVKQAANRIKKLETALRRIAETDTRRSRIARELQQTAARVLEGK